MALGMLFLFYKWGGFINAKDSINILVHGANVLVDGIDVFFVMILICGRAACQIPYSGYARDGKDDGRYECFLIHKHN